MEIYDIEYLDALLSIQHLSIVNSIYYIFYLLLLVLDHFCVV